MVFLVSVSKSGSVFFLHCEEFALRLLDYRMEFARIQSYVSDRKHALGLTTLGKPLCPRNPIDRTIEFIDERALWPHEYRLSQFGWDLHDFRNDYEFDVRVYFESRDGGRIACMERLVETVVDPTLSLESEFGAMPMQSIINKLKKSTIVHLRVHSTANEGDGLPDCKHLSLEIKDITNCNRKKKKNIKTGIKMAVNLYADWNYYNNLSLIGKLNLFSWCLQFGDFLKSFKNIILSQHSCGYSHRVQYDHNAEYVQCIKSVRLSPNDPPLRHVVKSYQIWPYINYPDGKPVAHIERFNSLHRDAYNPIYPIATKTTLDVISDSIAHSFRCHYLDLLRSELAGNTAFGFHQLAPKDTKCVEDAHRIKTFFIHRYQWETQFYRDLAAKFEAKEVEHELADDRLAAGLRYIGDDVPDFLRRFQACLVESGQLPNIEFDQISINLYKHRANNKNAATYSELVSHEESKKFAKLFAVSMGSDSVLSFDAAMGVDGTAGLELPSNSLIEYLMDGYFMSASRYARKNIDCLGGKHGVLKRHLRLAVGEWRIVVLFRVCHAENVAAARKHFVQCKNRDEHCYCLNPSLLVKSDGQ